MMGPSGVRLITTIAFSAALLFSGSCQALDPGTHINIYNHTTWTAKDGLPPDISTMAQTPDGWIWFGARSGLYRFDGVRFQSYQGGAGGSKMPQIGEISAEDNGDLWIGYNYGGAAVLHANGKLESFPSDLMTGANSIAIDIDGSAWIGAGNGLFHLIAGIWKKIGPADGVASSPDGRFLRDQYDRLWLTSDDQLYRYDRRQHRFIAQGQRKEDRIFQMSPDGRLWTGNSRALYPLAEDAGVPPNKRPLRFNQRSARGYGLFDRDGNFWTDACPVGLCIVPRAGELRTLLSPQSMATERLDQPWQLSSMQTRAVMEDREGNIWFLTVLGLERFRENKIRMFNPPGWLGYFSMARDTSGRVWAAHYPSYTAWALPMRGEVEALDGLPYSAVVNDRDGNMLIAGKRAIERRGRDGVEQIPLPPGPDSAKTDKKVFKMLDDGLVLWAHINQGVGKQGLVGTTWKKTERFGELPGDAYLYFNVGKSKVLAARVGGQVLVYDRQRLIARYEPRLGEITGLYDDGKEMLAGGGDGMAVLRDGRFERLNADTPADFEGVSGFVVTADGDHWFNGARGLVHVRGSDWKAGLVHLERPMPHELFDALDGFTGAAASDMPSLYEAGDGQLWFATSSGIGRVDPLRLTRNAVAPQAVVTAIAGIPVDSKTDGNPLRLGAGSSHFNIDFTAPSFAKPERVRFRYQLVGVDKGWQDAGNRRSAYYTNVGPGAYRFRVTATNEDGVAGEREAVLGFEIAPTVMQTSWFRAFIAVSIVALLYLLYRYSLSRAERNAVERLNLRVAERENIARDLHDTLLQSMQGVILKVHAIALRMPEQEPLRRSMEETVIQANAAMGEGRDRVRELRAETGSPTSLADALRGVAQQHNVDSVFSLDCEGSARRLHPIVQDEVLAMARECMINAFRHANAREVHTRLIFSDREFVFEVVDDGDGIPVDVVASRGREGHWGLISLFERARKIKAHLAHEAPLEGGTKWRCTVPAALAYQIDQKRRYRT